MPRAVERLQKLFVDVAPFFVGHPVSIPHHPRTCKRPAPRQGVHTPHERPTTLTCRASTDTASLQSTAGASGRLCPTRRAS